MSADRFKNRKGVQPRKENVRNERQVAADEAPKLVFSLKDFDYAQCPPGQTYEEWEKEGLLSTLLTELQYLCQWTVQEAIQNGRLAVYNKWPLKSRFRSPQHIASDVKWAVIKSVGGQKIRVAGHIINNVFYIVFLDKNHHFWVMNS